MANKFGNKKLETHRAEASEPIKTSSTSEQAVIGGIDSILQNIGDGLATAFTVLITGSLKNVKAEDFAKEVVASRNNNIFNNINNINRNLTELVEPIKNISKKLDTISTVIGGDETTYTLWGLIYMIETFSDFMYSVFNDESKFKSTTFAKVFKEQSKQLSDLIENRDAIKNTLSNVQSLMKDFNEDQKKLYQRLENILNSLASTQNKPEKLVEQKVIDYGATLNAIHDEITSLKDNNLNHKLTIEYIIDSSKAENLEELINSLSSLDEKTPEIISELVVGLEKVAEIDFKKLSESIDNLNAFSDVAIDGQLIHETFNNLNKIVTDASPVIAAINGIEALDVNKISDLKHIKEFIIAFSSLANSYDESTHADIRKDLELLLDLLPNKNGTSILSDIFEATNNLKQLSDDGRKNVDSLKIFFESFNKMAASNNLDIKQVKKNFGLLPELFENIAEIFDEISRYNFADDAANVIKQLEYLEQIFAKKIEVTSTVIENQQKNLDKIREGVERAKETAVKGTKINEDDLRESDESAFRIMDSIALLGLVMLLGGLIITKNEKIIVASLKFGITLSLFLLTLSLPIKHLLRISKIVGSREGVNAINEISTFIIKSSLIFILGSLVFTIGNGKVFRASLFFGIGLALFLRSLLIPIAFIARVVNKKVFDDVEQLGELVADLALIMIAGGLVMALGGGKYVGAALKFGLVLGVFIGLVMLPFALYSRLFKNAISGARDISRLMVACTLLMIIGAVIMMKGGGRYVKQALMFGIVLGLFIAAVIWPVITYGLLVKKEGADSIKQLTIFITASTALLVIGALIGMNNRLLTGALKFTGVLFAFISLSLLPFVIFNTQIRRLRRALGDIILCISLSTILLMIGAAVVNERPEIIYGALAFTAVLSAFILGTTLPFILVARTIRRAWAGVLALSAFVVASTMVMALGAQLVAEYGVKHLLIFPAILVGFTILIAGAFWLLSKTSVAILAAAASILVISTAIALMSFTFLLIKNTVDKIRFKDVLNFVIIVGLVVGVIALISAISSILVVGEAAAIGIGLVILAIAGSLLLLHYIVNKIDLIEDFKTLKVVVRAAVEVFVEIGKALGWIALGALGGLLMSVSLTALSFAFLLVHLLTSKYDSAEEFAILGVAIESAGVTFNKLGSMFFWIIGGMVSSIMMTISLIALGISFSIVHALISDYEIVEDVNKLSVAIDSLIDLFIKINSIGLGAAAKALAISLGIAFIITNLTYTFGLLKLLEKIKINDAVESILESMDGITSLMQKIDDSYGLLKLIKIKFITKQIRKSAKNLKTALKAIKELGEFAEKIQGDFNPQIIGDMISIFGHRDILKAIKRANEHHKEYKRFNKVISGTVNVISKLGKTIYDLSKLEIPIYDENGQLIGKRTLNNTDFINAAKNTYMIFSTLSDAVALVYQDNRELFESEVSSGLVGTIVGKKNRFDKVVSGMLHLGSAISKIGNAIGLIARLSMPTEFDSHGNPIAFRNMTKDDFTNASENIRIIIGTLSKAVLGVYEDNKELFDSEVSSGLIGAIIGKKNKFDKVVSGTLNLGKAVSSIAEAVHAYATLMIPTAFDENGKAIAFAPMTNDTFITASENIKKIILLLASAIGDVYTGNRELFESEVSTGLFRRIFKGKKNKFDLALSASMNIGNVVSSLATGLISMADLKFPIYNEDGSIKSYETISGDSMKRVGTNISLILTTIIDGIRLAYSKFDKDDNVKKVIESFSHIGNVISSIGSGIKDMTALNLPIYDSNGNIVNYKKLEQKDFDTLKDNIAKIITSTSDALKTAYDKLDMRPGKIENLINSFTPITTLLGSIIDVIVKYSGATIDSNGKAVNLKDATNQLSNNFNLLIGGVFDKFNEIYKNGKSGLLKKSNKELDNLINSTSAILNLFGVIINHVNSLKDINGTIMDNYRMLLNQIIGAGEYENSGLLSLIIGINISEEDFKVVQKSLKKIKDLTKTINYIFDFTNNLLKHKEDIENILNTQSSVRILHYHTDMYGIFKDIDIILSNIIALVNKKFNVRYADYTKLMTGVNTLKLVLNEIVTYRDSLYKLKELYELGLFNLGENNVMNIAVSFVTNGLNLLKSITKITNEENESISNTLKLFNDYLHKIVSISGSLSIIDTNLLLNPTMFDSINTYIDNIDVAMNTIREKLLGENTLNIDTLNSIFLKVGAYKRILTTLSELSFIEFYKKAEEEQEIFNADDRKTSLDIITESIKALNNELSAENTDRNIIRLNDEVNSLDKFVKVVNKIDINKAGRLTNLMTAMANLADKMGGFDKLADALNGEFSNVIDELGKKIEEANATINAAKEFEAEKKRDLDANVKKISELMDKSLTINVGKLNDDGSVSAQYEKVKK